MLPEEVLQQEIHTILSVGVELKLNSPVRNFNELIDDGYDAVLIAIGLSQGKKLAVPGNDFKGVLVGTEFLRCVNLGETVKVGKKVLVLGGGGVACDVALTARRLADSEVHVACLESRKAMPALPWEIEEAENEGVVIHPLQYFNRIVGDSGRATGVECLDLRWMKFDKNGSLHVDPITGSEHILEADTIILAIGQTLDLRLISDFPKIEITQRRTIVVDPDTMETGHLGVFASGDAVSGPASVIEAIAGGRKAASSIDKYLHGKGVIDEVLAPPEQVVIPLPPSLPIGERVSIPILPLEERLASFAKVELCLTEEMAIMEAKRCLRCDLPIIADPAKCTGCLICELRCSLRFEHTFAPLKAKIKIQRLIMADNEFEISFTDDCDGCGICVRYCPYEALARGQERRGLP
jgi:thioredoxin reductase/NAD-dependent dihydropyrimidine dehydrogenase PreA subunit